MNDRSLPAFRRVTGLRGNLEIGRFIATANYREKTIMRNIHEENTGAADRSKCSDGAASVPAPLFASYVSR